MGSEPGCPKRVAGKEISERIGRLRSLGKASLPSIPFPPLSCYPSPAPAPRPVPRLGRKFAVLPLYSHFPSRAKNGRILLCHGETADLLPSHFPAVSFVGRESIFGVCRSIPLREWVGVKKERKGRMQCIANGLTRHGKRGTGDGGLRSGEEDALPFARLSLSLSPLSLSSLRPFRFSQRPSLIAR